VVCPQVLCPRWWCEKLYQKDEEEEKRGEGAYGAKSAGSKVGVFIA